ncbi:hypothetical protein ACFQU2_15950 [Siccirubricoccus deserti]
MDRSAPAEEPADHGADGHHFGTGDGLSTERDRHYYALRAEGGVAAIVTEAMAVSEGGRAHNNSLWIYHDRFIPGLARLVEAIRQHDCLAIGQLNHRGGLLRRMVLNMEPVGPPLAQPEHRR